jgi:phospholipid N-methyltransferase
VAAQDQALQTKYYATKILNTETDCKCRLCQQFDETVDHIISACPILAKEQYIKRHDRVLHNYTSTYARKQRYNWAKNTGMNMCQNQ